MTKNTQSSSAPIPFAYPPDLVAALSHMPPGLRPGPILIFEGLSTREAVAATTADLQGNGTIFVPLPKTGSARLRARTVTLSQTALSYLGSGGSVPAGPLVIGRSGRPISPTTLGQELARACTAAGIARITLHDLRRLGAAWPAIVRRTHSLRPGAATTAPAIALPPLASAAVRRYLGDRPELPEPLSGMAVALCVYYNRPDVGQDIDSWRDGVDLKPIATAPTELIERARRYAAALGQPDRPMRTVFLSTLLRLALCWAHDDALSPAQCDIFSRFARRRYAQQEGLRARFPSRLTHFPTTIFVTRTGPYANRFRLPGAMEQGAAHGPTEGTNRAGTGNAEGHP